MSLRGEIVYLFAFDVGQEVVTAAVGPGFSRPGEPLDPRRRKTVPTDAVLYRPLTASPPAESVAVNGTQVSVDARVYDAGVITVSARLLFTAETLAELRTFHAPRVTTGEPLATVAQRACEHVRADLGNAIRGPSEIQGPETYTVFAITDLGDERDAGRWMD